MPVANGTRSNAPGANRRRPSNPAGGGAGRYTVRSGDTLNHIAKRNDLSLKDLLRANPQISSPNLIQPGQEIVVPSGVFPSRSTGNVTSNNSASAHSAGRPFSPAVSSQLERSAASLRRGARGPGVRNLQSILRAYGFDPGAADGQYGPRTQAAVRRFQISQGIRGDGVVGADTLRALSTPTWGGTLANRGGAVAGHSVARSGPSNVPNLQSYPPNSEAAYALFSEAADRAGVPRSWATSNGLHQILRKESNGRVGVLNYTYGARARDPSSWPGVWNELKAGRVTARSSASGLGQLLLSNVERYYPSGRAGIGDPVEEAVGMLKYIKDRYGNPDNAWRRYGTRHEGY
jgi:peptidoglycan hydrolase-like protein with peptidoglycan-binding domain